MATLICSLQLTFSWGGLQVEDMEQKNAVLMVCSRWETSVEQSSVLISEAQRNSLRHRRPSCFTFHSTACFTTDLARPPQNSSFVKASFSVAGPFDYLDSFPYHVPSDSRCSHKEVLMETHNETSNIPKDGHHLLRCAFPMVHCIPTKSTHNLS